MVKKARPGAQAKASSSSSGHCCDAVGRLLIPRPLAGTGEQCRPVAGDWTAGEGGWRVAFPREYLLELDSPAAAVDGGSRSPPSSSRVAPSPSAQKRRRIAPQILWPARHWRALPPAYLHHRFHLDRHGTSLRGCAVRAAASRLLEQALVAMVIRTRAPRDNGVRAPVVQVRRVPINGLGSGFRFSVLARDREMTTQRAPGDTSRRRSFASVLCLVIRGRMGREPCALGKEKMPGRPAARVAFFRLQAS